jgi:hypothetical protein
MTEPSNQGTAVSGWYPTAPGSPQLRWWDGSQWTEHFHTLGVTAPGLEKAPDGTKPGTVWIWIFAVLPLLQLAELPLLALFYRTIFSAASGDPTGLASVEFAPDSGYFAIQGLGLLLYAVYIVIGVLDYRALKARGVPRPFHWAWSFLSAIVYAIGRAVVVRRRTGSGRAPMWVFLLATVVTIVTVFAVLIPIVASVVGSLQ